MNGKFIAFEGIDGCGKTTQIRLFKKHLESSGKECIISKEPTDRPIGLLLRKVMSGDTAIDSRAAAALFAADRIDHAASPGGLCDTLKSGVTVLADRYCFSSYAYQSVDVDIDYIIAVNSVSTRLVKSDLTVFIDVPPEVSMERIAASRNSVEIYENKERLIKVRENYFKAFDRFKSENILVVDGTKNIDEIARTISENADKIFR